ncbi:hypothetical protein AAFG13_38365 [Bradyrhizobium sp. B124]|uniref:hypothetical protein n=1 Tax=Bradyrhizobium sp. B124 TaxID=3140245 RepID=UPI0031832AA6
MNGGSGSNAPRRAGGVVGGGRLDEFVDGAADPRTAVALTSICPDLRDDVGERIDTDGSKRGPQEHLLDAMGAFERRIVLINSGKRRSRTQGPIYLMVEDIMIRNDADATACVIHRRRVALVEFPASV